MLPLSALNLNQQITVSTNIPPAPIFLLLAKPRNWELHSLLVEELAKPALCVMICFNRHTILMEIIFNYLYFFFPPDKYVSPSLKFGSKSIVWICHTPCSLCPRCSQTLSTLSRLQHHEPLHILYWFLGIHSFTLTGSQHMSNLSCIAPSSSVSSKELRFAWTC